MTVFSGQIEKAGHFLQLATMAIGHKVIALLLLSLFEPRVERDVAHYKRVRLFEVVAPTAPAPEREGTRHNGLLSLRIVEAARGTRLRNPRTAPPASP